MGLHRKKWAIFNWFQLWLLGRTFIYNLRFDDELDDQSPWSDINEPSLKFLPVGNVNGPERLRHMRLDLPGPLHDESQSWELARAIAEKGLVIVHTTGSPIEFVLDRRNTTWGSVLIQHANQ